MNSCKLVNLFLVVIYLHLVCQTSTAPPLTCRISYVRFGVMQGRGRQTGKVITTVKVKVEKILKGTLDSIPSPSPSVEIQIMGVKFA